MKRISNITQLLVVGIMLAAFAVAAVAETTVDESRDVNSNARISIQNVAGSVTITGWVKKELSVTGTLEDDIEELRISGDKSDMEIEVVIPKRIRGRNKEIDADLVIRVPRGARLDVGTVSAEIVLRDVEGAADLGTVSGDIDIDDGPTDFDLGTVSGDIVINSPSKEAKIESVSGSITLKNASGDLSVSTVSGNVVLEKAMLAEFSFAAVSGDLELTGSMGDKANWQIDCHSGDVVLNMPADISAEFDIQSFSGDIENEFGPKARRTSKYAPGRELQFTAGDGDADVDIDMFSGDLELLKR